MDVGQLDHIGPFKVLRFVAEGAFAWVFEVRDPHFEGRRLALKLLKPEAAQGDEFRRFEAEAKLLAGIDHPNIVTIFASGREEIEGHAYRYYTMTFVDGPTLRDHLEGGHLSVEEGCRIGLQLLSGLAQLHEKRIIHRDVKPANVLLGSDGRSRLSDLGIARVETEKSQTRTGTAVGTALYMSPEQARGRPVDLRSDLFSVGLVLYESLTGNVVYDHVDSIDSSSGMDVLIYIGGLDRKKNAKFEMRFPTKPAIPRSVKQVLRRACSLRPEDRYPDASSMAKELQAALDGHLRAPAAAPVPFKLMAGIAGVIVAVTTALAIYFGAVKPNLALSGVLEQATKVSDETNSLSEGARRIFDTARQGKPRPSAAVLADVEDRLDRADDYFRSGREALAEATEGEDVRTYRTAMTYMQDAQPHYHGACDALNEGFLAARAQESVIGAEESIAALQAQGAADAGLSSWPALVALVPALAAPGQLAGCPAAVAQLSRIEASASATTAAAAVADELDSAWPRLARAMRERAAEAKATALQSSIADRDFRAAIREGKRLFVRAEFSEDDENFRKALDQYRASEEAFAAATEIARTRSTGDDPAG